VHHRIHIDIHAVRNAALHNLTKEIDPASHQEDQQGTAVSPLNPRWATPALIALPLVRPSGVVAPLGRWYWCCGGHQFLQWL
jgi:hypothetical protein